MKIRMINQLKQTYFEPTITIFKNKHPQHQKDPK